MRKPDIFDEIIFYLREAATGRVDTCVPPETWQLLSESAKIQRATETDSVAADAPAQPVTSATSQKKFPAKTPAATPQNAPAASLEITPEIIAGASWEKLQDLTASCRLCQLADTRTNVVFEDGSRNAELMFIGEGPGADEDAQGIPFVGRAGELLTKMILAMQYARNQVYIANIVKCRPPENRNPSETESARCIPYLKRQIQLVHPKAIVLLGAVPLLYLLNMKGISRLRGQWFDYEGIRVMPTFHPAYLLRDPSKKALVWLDLQEVMRCLGKTPVHHTK